MIRLIPLLLLTGCASIPCDQYASIGAGYKFRQSTIDYWDGSEQSPISARIEIGSDCEGYRYGVSHHSQWLKGWPLNDEMEYSKTEIFIDWVIKE